MDQRRKDLLLKASDPETRKCLRCGKRQFYLVDISGWSIFGRDGEWI